MGENHIEAEIAVVGAGPSGLATAVLLAEAGVSVALIAPGLPPDDHRTAALFTGSIELIEHTGVWSKLLGKAAPLRTMRLVDATKRLIRAPEIAFHASEIGLAAFGYNIHNRDLTEALSAVAATKVESILRVESEAAEIDLGHGRPRIVTADGRTVVARLVVGADGRRSAVREAAGIKARRWTYPQSALVLNLDHTVSHYDCSTEFHTETGPFTLVPLAPRRSSLVCVEKPEAAERLAALDDAALAEELERRAFSILGRFTVASPRQTWPLSGLAAETLGRGRVVLVGEAGHAFPPIGAQGLNLGLRDVGSLVEAVRRAKTRGEDVGGEGVVAGYASARRADVTTRTLGVHLLNRSLLTDFLPVQIARAAALQIARDIEPLRKLMMQEGLRPRLFQTA